MRLIEQHSSFGRPNTVLHREIDVDGDGFSQCVARHGEEAVEFYNAMRAHQLATAALDGGE